VVSVSLKTVTTLHPVLPAFSELLDVLGIGPDEYVSINWKAPAGDFRTKVVARKHAPMEAAKHEGCDVWFGVNPLTDKPTGRGTAEDVNRLVALWADLDAYKGGPPDEVIDSLTTFLGQPPAAIVDSGGGKHPYWLIDSEGETLARCAEVLAWWGEKVRIEAGTTDSVFDLPRILRVPGTENHKEGTPRPVTAVFDPKAKPLILGDVEAFLASSKVPKAKAKRLSAKSGGTGVARATISEHTTWEYADETCQYAKKMVRGWDTDEPTKGRHPWLVSQCVRLASAMRLGCFDEDGFLEAVRLLEASFTEMCEHGIGGLSRDVQYNEIADAFDAGVARAEAKTEEECWAELGDHEHIEVIVHVDEAAILEMDEPRLTRKERKALAEAAEHAEAVEKELRRLRAQQQAKEILRAEEEGARDYSGFAPADLSAALLVPPPAPELMERTDGVCGLYRGKIHTIGGEYESGKSWVMLMVAAQVLAAGGFVAILDWEDTAHTFASRMQALGVAHSVLTDPERVTYVNPPHALDDRSWPMIEAAVDGVDFIGIDGTSDAMTQHGLNPFSGNDDSSVKWGRIVRRIRDASPEAAILTVDHVTKNADTRGRHLIGSQHKGSGLDGPLFIVDRVVEPFGAGLMGRAEIWVAKDRPGKVRSECGPMSDGTRMQHFGDFVLDSTGTVSKAYIEPWDMTTGPSKARAERDREEKVYTFIEEYHTRCGEGATKAAIRSGVKGKAITTDAAIVRLFLDGHIRKVDGKTAHGEYYAPMDPPNPPLGVRIATTLDEEEIFS
jgi:hypothetical protein